MVADVAAGTAFLEIVGSNMGKAQGVIQFSECQQSGVGSDGGTMAAVQYVQYPHYRALILRKTVTRLDGGVGCSAFALASVVFENLNHERRHVGAPVERFDLEPVVELAGDPAL